MFSSSGLPLGLIVLLDATQPSTIRLGGVPVQPGSNIDQWGIATQPTPSQTPFYDDMGLGGGPCVVFGQNGSPWLLQPPTNLLLPSDAFGVPYSIIAFFRCDGAAMLYEISTDASSAPGANLRSDGSTTIEVTNGSGTRTANASATWGTIDTPMYIEQGCDGTDVTLRKNGTLLGLTEGGVAPGSGAITTVGTVGSGHAISSPMVGSIGLLAYTLGPLSANDRSQLDSWIRARWRLPLTSGPARNVLGSGDSILAGEQTVSSGFSTAAYSFMNRMCLGMGSNFTPHNFGAAGAQLGTITTIWTVSCIPLIIPGIMNIGICQGGTNDISVLAPGSWNAAVADANTVLARYATFVTTAVASLHGVSGGPHHVFVFTISYDSTATKYREYCRILTNILIRNNYASWGATDVFVHLVDIGADKILGTPYGAYVNTAWVNNPNFFADNIHPAKAGQWRWAGMLMQKMIQIGL